MKKEFESEEDKARLWEETADISEDGSIENEIAFATKIMRKIDLKERKRKIPDISIRDNHPVRQ
ncbi:hypothetical protein HY990_03355 [Candidatus Micrarchaeota archaeon]|nr:hypothetical protein [Candidatus Micrarchaeota archaeon]